MLAIIGISIVCGAIMIIDHFSSKQMEKDLKTIEEATMELRSRN